MLKAILKLLVKKYTLANVRDYHLDPDERLYIKKIKGHYYAYARKRTKHKLTKRYYDKFISACDPQGFEIYRDNGEYIRRGNRGDILLMWGGFGKG